MKLLSVLVFLFAFTIQTLTCKNETSFDQELTLKYGQTIDLKKQDLKIKFVSVDEDSRCPQGEQCIRAGSGVITLEVMKLSNGKTSSITLNTSGELNEVVYQGIAIKLIELQPFPKSGLEIKTDDYAAKLRVYKQDN